MIRFGLPLLLGLLFLGLFLSGCGVRFSDPPSDVDIFEELKLDGSPSVGLPFSLTLTVNSTYSVPVEVACFSEATASGDEDETEDDTVVAPTRFASFLVEPAASPGPGGAGERDLVVLTLTFAERGTYLITCLTPAVPANAVSVTADVE